MSESRSEDREAEACFYRTVYVIELILECSDGLVEERRVCEIDGNVRARCRRLFFATNNYCRR
jgi:hypothetical protein